MEVFDWYIGEIADHEGSDVLTDETHIARLRRRALKRLLRKEHRKAPGKRHAATTKELKKRRRSGVRAGPGGRNVRVVREPGPLLTSDGTPYLEPHHTTKLSDGGPDKPRSVGAICPNCHREIHHGAEGDEKNRRL